MSQKKIKKERKRRRESSCVSCCWRHFVISHHLVTKHPFPPGLFSYKCTPSQLCFFFFSSCFSFYLSTTMLLIHVHSTPWCWMCGWYGRMHDQSRVMSDRSCSMFLQNYYYSCNSLFPRFNLQDCVLQIFKGHTLCSKRTKVTWKSHDSPCLLLQQRRRCVSWGSGRSAPVRGHSRGSSVFVSSCPL